MKINEAKHREIPEEKKKLIGAAVYPRYRAGQQP